MRRCAATGLALVAWAGGGGVAAQPGSAASAGTPAACGAGLADAQRVEGARYAVAFAPRPPRWTLGRHFAVEFVVCPKGQTLPPDAVRVDARMPEHGHGMNYRPSLVALGPGHWRAEGLLLHMAGRWELLFELQEGGQVERLTQDLRLR